MVRRVEVGLRRAVVLKAVEIGPARAEEKNRATRLRDVRKEQRMIIGSRQRRERANSREKVVHGREEGWKNRHRLEEGMGDVTERSDAYHHPPPLPPPPPPPPL
jgi:hypothetical protein